MALIAIGRKAQKKGALECAGSTRWDGEKFVGDVTA